MIIKIPRELKELQEPWLADVPEKYKKWLRQGAFTLTLNGKRYLHEWTHDGKGIKNPIDEATYLIYSEYERKEGFPHHTDPKSRLALGLFLEGHGVTLLREDTAVPGAAYDLAQKIYELLPKHHYGHEHFTKLKLTGEGRGIVAGSQHGDSTIRMFDFAVYGPRRNFIGLLLHETGHAHFESLDGAVQDAIDIIRQNLQTPFAIDYLDGPNERWKATRNSRNEFPAEFYMIYVTQGARFRTFLQAIDERERTAWQNLYDIYKASFDGREYR